MDEAARIRQQVTQFDVIVASMFGVSEREIAVLFDVAKAGEASALLTTL